MENHRPDKLPPLTVDLGIDPYGYEATFVQVDRPATKAIADEAFYLCRVAIARKSERIENAYPAHIGGTEQYNLLRILARQNDVELQFPATDGK